MAGGWSGPDGTTTRPTTDRVREAIFNSLGSAGLIEGALVADLFAGSGALGIEALSRGAEHCVFVERDRTALRALDANLDALELRSRSKVITSDVMSVAGSIDADIVFADPPYDFDEWPTAARTPQVDVLVAESGRAIEPARAGSAADQAVRPHHRHHLERLRGTDERTRFPTR